MSKRLIPILLLCLLTFTTVGRSGEVDVREVKVSMWPYCRQASKGESWSFALTQEDGVLAHAIGWKIETTLPADEEKAKITRTFKRAGLRVNLHEELVLRVDGSGLPPNMVRTNWSVEVTDAEGRIFHTRTVTSDSAERRFRLELKK